MTPACYFKQTDYEVLDHHLFLIKSVPLGDLARSASANNPAPSLAPASMFLFLSAISLSA